MLRKSVTERVRKNVPLLLLFAYCLTSVVAYAQSTAQINGTIRDQTGAVLPGVEVTVSQTETGLTRTAVTDETGSYILTNLPVGPYRLEAALPGFRAYVQTGIVLQVNSNPSINAVLEVGQIADQIEVQADAALVETRSTGVGQVIDNVRVLELPLNGRRVSELIILSGAAIAGGTQPVAGRSYPTESISVAGGMNNGLTYMLDGGVHNDPYNNLNLPLPFPDAMQEFKVETSAVPAQYGQHSAGAVNAVTKSGTNDFHGSLFEFVRNKVFNARNAFAVTRDGLKRNQFGGTAGGPIVRNKLFFFGAYQATIQRSEPTDNREYVPTAAMLAGDWTAISSPACNAGRQVTLRAPFVNNRIDPALFVTPALNLVKRLPATADPCGETRYGRRTNSDEHMIVGKTDYQLTDKHSLFGRYEFAQLDTPHDYDGTNILTFKANNTHMQVQSLVLGDTYLLGSGMVSSFRGTLNRTVVEQVNPQDFFTLGDLGVKNLYYPPGYNRHTRLTVTPGFAIGSATTLPGVTNSTIFHFGEDLGLVHGAHQLGFGASYINSRLNLVASTLAPGTMTFGTTNTGLGLGDFMLGKPGNWSQGGVTTYYYRQHYIALYLQDTWKANSRLTVNAGVRWEPYLSPWDKNGRIVHFDQKAFDQGLRSTVFKKAPVGLVYPGDPGVSDSKSLMSHHWGHFTPRIGLAYDPSGNGRMTIRAAYGVFFDFPHFYQFNAQRDLAPWGARVVLANPPGGFENPWQDYPGGNPYPVIVNANVEFPSSATYTNIPWNLKLPYVHQWNLSLQRQIGTDWLVSGNYLGNSVIHLMDSYESNPAIYLPGASCVIAGRTYSPCSSTGNTIQRRKLSLQNPAEGQFYGNLVTVDDGGTRSFNGLLLSVQRRRSKGVTVQTNYTLSHCIDDGTKPMFQNTGEEIPERRRFNRGNCESDRRHNFNLSTVYETPQFSSRALQALASGWRVSGILRILSGSYLTVSSGLDNALSGTADQRPDRVLPNPYPSKQTTDQWLNPAAFVQPAIGTYGNMGPRNVVGPGSIRVDMGLTRSFRVRESQSVEFRAEAFNLPNHLNPGNPTTALSNATFGRILTASDPRIIQLALKYVF